MWFIHFKTDSKTIVIEYLELMIEKAEPFGSAYL